MKRLIYLSMAAMMVLAVSCKKDPKVGTPSVKTLEVTEIGPYSARLNAKIDFAGVNWGGVNYGFYWGTSEDQEGTYIQGDGTLTDNGPYSAVITGLAPETEYWFKAFIEIDDVPYSGEILNFTTDVSPIPEGAVDLGIEMTRGDGTTYKLYWAKSNLCESGLCANPEDYGDYYAWGDTEPYYSSQDPLTWKDGKTGGYAWATYKWSEGTYKTLTKYNTSSSYGSVVDNITELQRKENPGETMDDVARAKLGGKWRMPTEAEWKELMEKCNCEEWTANYNGTGAKGRIVTADNGNSIFLPAAGSWDNALFLFSGSLGYYLSSSINTERPYFSLVLFIDSFSVSLKSEQRYYGFSVRPVCEE